MFVCKPGTWRAFRLFAIAAALVAGCLRASSSEYSVRVWGTIHGLPQSTIHTIAQTRDGFLWLGTDSGIARFDGVRFFTLNQSNLPRLPSDRIAHLRIDRSGTLWIVTDDGSIGYLEHGAFHPVKWPPGVDPSPVASFEESAESGFNVGLIDGNLLQLRDRVLNSGVALPNSLAPDNGLRHIRTLTDSDGFLWLGNRKGLARRKGEIWHTVFGEDEISFTFPPSGQVPLLAPSKSGIWIAAGHRVRRYFDGSWEDEHAFPWGGPQAAAVLLEDRKGRLWIGADGGGLHYFDTDGGDSVTAEQGMPSNHIRSLFEDREGNLWVGTDGGGLVRIRERIFRQFFPEERLLNVPVNSVFEDSTHDLWFGTSGSGAIHWNGYRFLRIEGFDVSDIRCALVGREGQGWIGGVGIGVWMIAASSASEDPYKSEPLEPLAGKNVRCLFEADTGDLYIGTDKQLFVRRGNRVENLSGWLDMKNEGVTALGQSADALWVGTSRGLLRIVNGKPQRLRKSQGWPEVPVTAIALHSEDRSVWFGTAEGLVRYVDGRFFPLSHREGDPVPEAKMASLVWDLENKLWAGTNRGVFRINYADLVAVSEGSLDEISWEHFDDEDGLTSVECSVNQPGGFLSETGRIYIPTRKGLFFVDPTRERSDSPAPEVIVEEFRVDGEQRGDLFGESPLEELRVAPGLRQIAIHYTAINLAAPDKVRFRYRLTGFRDEWFDVGDKRVAEFHGLPAGDYELEVLAANHQGKWSTNPARVSVHVEAHIWQKGWFKVFIAIALCSLGALIAQRVLRARARSRLAELEKSRAIADERTRIAEDMHDDLGARLTQIALVGEMASQEQVSSESRVKRLRQIVESARDAAGAMDELVWAVNPRNDTLSRVASYLSAFAREYCEFAGLVSRLKVPHSFPDHELSGALRHALYLAVKEALNNIAKHANAGSVEFAMELQDAVLCINLEDDGEGFDAANAVTGNGIQNLHSRLRPFGGSATITSIRGKGTTVSLQVPLPSHQ